MCGIIGYVGKENSIDIMIGGLKKLEYRGYDSAGIAFKENNNIKVIKSKGKINNLEKKLIKQKYNTNCGIGHTRWATHGEANEINAHPHSSKNLSIVHNGIIENYLDIKKMLIDKGFTFESETDTEVLAKLIDYNYNEDKEEAINKSLKMVKGSYALGIIFNDENNKIYAIKKDSPLIIGISEKGNYIASDICAIANHTKEYINLNDDEMVIIDEKEYTIKSNNKVIQKEIEKVSWDIETVDKGDFEDFMIKEICEQPELINNLLEQKIKNNDYNFQIKNLDDEYLKKVDNIYIVACGTAMNAALIAKRLIEDMARKIVMVEIASEFRYNNPLLTEKDLVILVSQSGETADTLAALKLSKSKGSKTLSIVNVKNSSIANESDSVIYLNAGKEISVASTKAYMMMVTTFFMFSLKLSIINNSKTENDVKEIILKLKDIPKLMSEIIEKREDIKEISKLIKDSKNLFYIGRNIDYFLAIESSLKLKEISYIHSEAYASGELKHGTISLIEKGTPVISIATQDNVYEKTISNIKEVKARGAKTILICKKNNKHINDISDHVIYIEDIEDILTPFLVITITQLIAYYTSKLKEIDVDQPRNLAKSVTVE